MNNPNAENHHQYLKNQFESNQQQQMQNMSQTAQIVLLPAPMPTTVTGTIPVKPNSPLHQEQQQQVQMILPNDVGYQIAFPNVNVLNTAILITDKNECIFIPQNSLCQSIPLETKTNHQIIHTGATTVDAAASPFANVVEYPSNDVRGQYTQEQECEFITLANNGTQTVIAGIPAENEVANQNTAQLLQNPHGCQILGIINTNQIGILQQNQSGNTENQVLLLEAPADDHQSIQMASQPTVIVTDSTTADKYDVNAFLASTISSGTIEKSDPNQAKEWLKDSCIVNRALKALKKADQRSPRSSDHRSPGSSSSSQQQPNQQQQYWRNDRPKSNFLEG